MNLTKLIFILAIFSHIQASVALAEKMIETAVTINAPREKVWDAWTTPEGMESWFAPADIDLRIGGDYVVKIIPQAPEGSRGNEGGTVLAWTPGRAISFTWNAPPALEELRAAGSRTQVNVSLRTVAGGATEVVLVQHGFGEGDHWDDCEAYFRSAWPAVLRRLKLRMEQMYPLKAVETRHWLCLLRPAREEMLTAPTKDEQILVGRHAEHLARLAREGRVILAGPAMEPTIAPTGEKAALLGMPAPGVVIFEAPDEAAALEILNADPAVEAGVFKAQVNPISLPITREGVKP